MKLERFNPDLSPVSFGRYIREIRRQKGIDLRTVAEEIDVSLYQLSLIESEDHEELPDARRVKNILKSYSDFIGLDSSDIIDRYEVSRSAYACWASEPGKRGRGVKKAVFRAIAALFFLSAAGALSFLAFTGGDKGAAESSDSEEVLPSRKAAAAAEYSRDAGRFVLVIDALEKTWIKIGIDGEETLEYLLRPKDHVELEAEKHYHMLIGNAGGIEMSLNGEPVDIPGGSGEVVTIQLPEPQKGGKRGKHAFRKE